MLLNVDGLVVGYRRKDELRSEATGEPSQDSGAPARATRPRRGPGGLEPSSPHRPMAVLGGGESLVEIGERGLLLELGEDRVEVRAVDLGLEELALASVVG